MKLQLYVIFVFLIFQFLFYGSQSTVEYTFNKDDLIKYPSSSSKNLCTFSINILFKNLEQEIQYITATPFTTDDINFSNDKKSTSIRISRLNVPFGDYTFNISFFNSSTQLNITQFYSINLNYSCKEFNFTELKITPLLSGYTLGFLFLINQLNNFPKNLYLVDKDSNMVESKYFGGNNKYLFQIEKIDSVTSPLKFSILFYGGKTLSFTINQPFQTNTFTEIKSLEYYPKDNITFSDNRIGFVELKLKTNSTNLMINSGSHFPPLKVGTNDMGEVFYIIPFIRPINPQSIKIQDGVSIIEKIVNLPIMEFNDSLIVSTYGNYIDNGEYINFEGTKFLNLVNIGFTGTSKNKKERERLAFPFGFVGGNSNQSFFSVSFIYYQTYQQNYFTIFYNGINLYIFSSTIGSSDTAPPKLLDYEISISNYDTILFKLKVSDNKSGIKSISSSSSDYITFGESLVSGSSLNATLEFRVPYSNINSITLCDYSMNCDSYYLDSYYFLESSNITYLKSPSSLFSISNEFDISNCIQDISFKYNDISVTDNSIANVMYLDIINFPTDREFTIDILANPSSFYINPTTYIASYNTVSKKFECDFIVPANINTGPLQFRIYVYTHTYYSIFLPTRFQLNIKESLNIDLVGPIVNKSSRYLDSNSNTFGWEISFENDINGYKDGYILVRSSIDMVVRNISGILSSGTIFNGTYKFSVTISQNCISQTYSIKYARFIDTQGQETIYDQSSIYLINPFYKLLNDKDDFRNCDIYCDSSLLSPMGKSVDPILNSFSFTPTSVEVFSTTNRKVLFTYTASHPDGLLISDSIYPIIYLTSLNQEFVTGVQSTAIQSSNKTHVNYLTTLEIPYGLGFSGSNFSQSLIIVNCYGFISNAGTNMGYTSRFLKDMGFQYKINPLMNFVNVILTESSQLSSNGGKLLVYGRFLSLVYSVTVEYDNKQNIHTPKQISDSQFLLDDILATDNYISITATLISGVYSNNLIVYPKLFKNTTLPRPSTPTPTSTQTPIEIKCKTTCGGESNKQGYCSKTQGVCICYSPWIGVDCQSQIITVPPPKINQTNPSTEITTPSNSSEITYSSIVSIVSIRELDFSNNVVNNYTFEKWVFKSIIDTDNKKVFNYFSNITINNQVVSNITSTLEWNSNASIIQFAGQDISLNPSSIKYTISISKYNFISQLNTLQLIMSASIQTQDNQLNEECSSKSFGDSSSSPNQNIIDSNYIQLQVNDHSFYGRFIKRCLLDSRTVSITNSILDDNLTEQKSNKVNSFIGINIPWYSNQAIIDPDFSVLLGQPDNSCNRINGDSSGLTKSQLIVYK
ncbi:hypothetical protein ACTA71_007042 [Dictyostelium dimigraforme]